MTQQDDADGALATEFGFAVANEVDEPAEEVGDGVVLWAEVVSTSPITAAMPTHQLARGTVDRVDDAFDLGALVEGVGEGVDEALGELLKGDIVALEAVQADEQELPSVRTSELRAGADGRAAHLLQHGARRESIGVFHVAVQGGVSRMRPRRVAGESKPETTSVAMLQLHWHHSDMHSTVHWKAKPPGPGADEGRCLSPRGSGLDAILRQRDLADATFGRRRGHRMRRRRAGRSRRDVARWLLARVRVHGHRCHSSVRGDILLATALELCRCPERER
jgi:hypothetical protein